MGSEVLATCQCGLETSIQIGVGMAGPKPCFFPCLCERCRAVVEVDLLSKKLRCPKCKSTKVIPYDDPTLSEPAGRGAEVAEWNAQEELGRVLTLTDKNYRCPQCGQMTLRFASTGDYWD